MPGTKTGARAHFIANTHLDREWTMDFHHTRMLTVEFLDNLIPLMQEVPEYHFLLDAQTVPLEDYFEIRPQNEAALTRLIKAGRVHIGPWYTALDMNCISGETVTRNILLGHLVAEQYGQPMKVGYTPFGWGQISQLPQIYDNFDIDVAVYYRGITPAQAPQAEFVWAGADGTELLCSRLGVGGRAAFYFFVWREALYAGHDARLARDLDWQDHQVPFKLCDADNRFDHGTLLQPTRELDEKALKKAFRRLIAEQKKHFSTAELAFMHGMDTSMPDIREDEVLKRCQDYLKPGEEFFHSSLPYFAKCVKKAVKGRRLTRIEGEVKFYEPFPGETLGVANEIISARSGQKILNAKAENLLQRSAEPFATIAHQLGAPYPKEYLTLAWKKFLRCHAHDTIGGCSIDRVEEDARHRLKEVLSLSNMVLKEGLGAIQANIDTSEFRADQLLLTVFNPSPFARSEVVTAHVDVPRAAGINRPGVFTVDGDVVPSVSAATGHGGKVFRDRTDLALMASTDEYELTFAADAIPPLGYRTYVVGKRRRQRAGKLSPAANVLENEFLNVKINPNGTIDLTDKTTETTIRSLHVFVDDAEAGHAWTHYAPLHLRPITSKRAKAEVSCVSNSAVAASYRVCLTLQIPATTNYPNNPVAEPQQVKRSRKRLPLRIESVVTLTRGGRSVDIETTVVNNSRNHRLRLLLPTGIRARDSHADVAYDVVARRIKRDHRNPYRDLPELTFNFQKFVDLSDGKRGFAFISNGLREYEVLDDNDRTLAITLFRACPIRLCTTSYETLEDRPGDLGQCLGENRFRYSLLPHAGDWQAPATAAAAERVNYPLLVCEAGPGQGGSLPLQQGFVELIGDGLGLSGIKKSDRDDSIIIRVFNPTDTAVAGQLRLMQPVEAAQIVTMNETPVKGGKLKPNGNNVPLSLAPKRVLTVSLRLTLQPETAWA